VIQQAGNASCGDEFYRKPCWASIFAERSVNAVQTRKLASKLSEKVIPWPWMLLIFLAVFAVFFFAIRSGEQDLQTARQQQKESGEALILANDELNSLRAEISQVGSSSYIENAARNNYGYLKPGELRFEIANPENLKGYTYEELQIRVSELLQ